MLSKEILLNSKNLGFKITVQYSWLGTPSSSPYYFRVDLPSENISGESQCTIKVVQISHDRDGCWYELYIDSKYIGIFEGGKNSSSYITRDHTFIMPNKDITIKLHSGYGPT